jgi:hypothetical protein
MMEEKIIAIFKKREPKPQNSIMNTLSHHFGNVFKNIRENSKSLTAPAPNTPRFGD